MKSLILWCTAMIIAGTIVGQDYIPLVADDKEWNVLQEIFSYPPPTTHYTMNYKFDGDTVLNSIAYQKVYGYCPEQGVEDWIYMGGIREENKKVYYNPLGEEKLKYDFGAEIGDTIIVEVNSSYTETLIVESIDSILVENEYLKKMNLVYSLSNFSEIWIESIGSNIGVLHSGTAVAVGGWTWLLCMHQEGELVYMNPDYTSCQMNNVSVSELEQHDITIYPNPAKDYLMIKVEENIDIQSIRIFNSNACKVFETGYSSDKIDISSLPIGLYYLEISTSTSRINRKFVKQ
jgi:hypothetical protein